MAAPDNPEEFDIYDPANVSPFVVWLCTDEAQEVNGQAFIVGGSGIWWMRNWSHQNNVKLDAERWTLASDRRSSRSLIWRDGNRITEI